MRGGVGGSAKFHRLAQNTAHISRNALASGLYDHGKNRVLSVSIKVIEIDDEKAAIQEHRNQDAGDAAPATIGDLIKAQMDKS